MSRETLVKDNEGNTYSFDNLATQKWLEGHYSGLDQCCTWLDQKANALFGQRKRDEAIKLQSLADELKKGLRPLMVERAKEHEKEFPYKLGEEANNVE